MGFFDDGLGQVEPEIVALEGQSIEEVEKLVSEPCSEVKIENEAAKKRLEERSCRSECHVKDIEQTKEYLAKAVKLTYDDAACVNEHEFWSTRTRPDVRLTKDLNLFNTWRKLADVEDCGEKGTACLPENLGPTQELMEYILLKLNHKFPKLKLCWSSGWNPCLMINNNPTQIVMDRIAFAHNGLTKITDDLNAQAIITNIIMKKLEALFI